MREEAPSTFIKSLLLAPLVVTTFDHIMAVDRNNQQFSSASGITLVDQNTDLRTQSFITADQPNTARNARLFRTWLRKTCKI